MSQNKQFIVVHQKILELDSLSFSEKLVLSRIAGFETYYESKEHLSAFFGGTINPLTCRKIKAKLVALGYIIAIKDTGRGKVYQCDFDKLGIPKPEETQTQEKVAQEQIIGESAIESASQSVITMTPYNKVRRKKNIDSKESILAQEPSGDVEKVDGSTKCEERIEFGNADVNEALEQWCEATGYDLKSNKYERRAMFNLLRRKDINALGGLKVLLKLVKEASGIDSQFAPRIVKPSELGGKYSKLERLLEWSKRKDSDSRSQTTSKQKKFEHKCSEQELAYISSYYRPHPYCEEEPESKPMTAEEEAEWKKARHEETLRARAIFEKRMQEKADAKKGEQ